MNFPFFIARKYFFSRKISNVIHLISAISLLGVTVGTFALIVVLSVFNGFENVVVSLFNTFDSDIKIIPAHGKYFDPDSARFDRLKELKGVVAITEVIEEIALVKYSENQSVATLKVISPGYLPSTGMDSMVIIGNSKLTEGEVSFALVGAGVASKLGVNIFNEFHSLQLFVPDRTTRVNIHLNPERAFVRRNVYPSGIFSIQQDFDNKYLVIPLDFARDLFRHPEMVTAIEMNLTPGLDPSNVRKQVQEIVGDQFIVQDRFQQHAFLYRIMRSEKLAVYLILSFILLIAAFNLIGALMMLAMEKKKDMAVLRSMGAPSITVKNIFLYEGMLLSSIGAIAGMGLGYIVGWVQQTFEVIKITSGSTFVLTAYPVKFLYTDFILVFLTAILLGLIASYIPARVAYRQVSSADLHG